MENKNSLTSVLFILAILIVNPALSAELKITADFVLGNTIEKQFNQALQEMDTEALNFVSSWDQSATDCNTVKNTIFGNIKTPCRAVRAALRRGTLLKFQQQCIANGAAFFSTLTETQQFQIELEQNPAQLESRLIAYENSLIAICNFANYENAYPTFNELLAEAKVARPMNFDDFGTMDSMDWWSFQSDPAANSISINPQLPAILGGQ